jgi:hypothetical protein
MVGQAWPPVLVNWFTLCEGAGGHGPMFAAWISSRQAATLQPGLRGIYD